MTQFVCPSVEQMVRTFFVFVAKDLLSRKEKNSHGKVKSIDILTALQNYCLFSFVFFPLVIVF